MATADPRERVRRALRTSLVHAWRRPAAALSSDTLVKLFHWSLAAISVSLCACTVAPSPTAPSATITADTLAANDGFEPAFFRAFVQNAYEAPGRLEPIRVLRGPLRLYLRTEDDAGRAIDRITLETTERTLIDSARIWSGEKFGVVQVERGTRTREKVPGWITVKWPSTSLGDRCGRSTVGVEGGVIELNASGACSCGMATAIYPRLVRHELGHAMGYYHTDHIADVMYGEPIPITACDTLPSERERRHARFAHAELQ